ncbi:CaiB/BaiF CoA transferase family protein [Microbacterium sp. A93]|uniref:CaiB/BaiF CoA transferase family protein n=1 Tax=Microbacterium sp. A93 TaxID=3450716 RepID=UPI003F42E5FD
MVKVEEGRTGALAGVRVLDFSWVVAGPMSTALLAGLGAEVIRVEWPERADNMRRALFAPGIEPTLDTSCIFATVNIGKRALSIDARHPEGREVLEKLIREVDVVTESFSAGVLAGWGFSYERMRELNPRIIYVSLSGFGHTGRYKDFLSYGPTAQSFNGMTHMSGLPGEQPAGWGFSAMDVVAGWHAAIAVNAALYERSSSGEGQHVDIAQVETGLALLGGAFLDSTVNGNGDGRHGVPPGNRSEWPDAADARGLRGEVGAPYNCYPTNGGERFDYCAITVMTDSQWHALVRAMGSPEWALDPRFEGVDGRLAAQEYLDEKVAEWTRGQDKFDVMNVLQAAGVPAGALQSPEEIAEKDPQLEHRELHIDATHPLLGRRRWESFAFSLSDTPPVFTEHWPLLGGDNDYVLGEIAGLSAEEIERLDRDNVTWPAGMPRSVKVEGALW